MAKILFLQPFFLYFFVALIIFNTSAKACDQFFALFKRDTVNSQVDEGREQKDLLPIIFLPKEIILQIVASVEDKDNLRKVCKTFSQMASKTNIVDLMRQPDALFSLKDKEEFARLFCKNTSNVFGDLSLESIKQIMKNICSLASLRQISFLKELLYYTVNENLNSYHSVNIIQEIMREDDIRKLFLNDHSCATSILLGFIRKSNGIYIRSEQPSLIPINRLPALTFINEKIYSVRLSKDGTRDKKELNLSVNDFMAALNAMGLLYFSNDNSKLMIKMCSQLAGLIGPNGGHRFYPGDEAIIRELLSLGVDSNLIPKDDPTSPPPLYLAAEKGNVEIATLLLEHGAQVNVRYRKGATPIFKAAKEGHVDMVKLLTCWDSDPNICDNENSTPLYEAAQNGHEGVVEYLLSLDKVHPEKPGYLDGYTPLYIAAQNGHLLVVIELLKYKVEIDKKAPNGATALYIAAQNGHHKVVECLLDAGANPNIFYTAGYTPLYVAAQKGFYEVVDILLNKQNLAFKVDINFPTYKKATPFYVAAQQDHIKVMNCLIKAGANMDSQFEDGSTAMHVSVNENRIRIIEFLLKNGASITIKNNKGQTAFDLAKEKNNARIIKIFENQDEEMDLDPGPEVLSSSCLRWF